MTTSDVRDAWTEGAEVAVVLCGDKCDSSVQPLVTDDSLVLRRGCTAHFTVLHEHQLPPIISLFHHC